jgi:hypothetical protein
MEIFFLEDDWSWEDDDILGRPAGLALMGVQFGALARLTWEEYS